VIDNLFIVESPLQALVAVELSLQFVGQENGVICRLSGKGRERNDEQICKVLEWGNWSFKDTVQFSSKGRILWHLNARRCILKIKEKYRNDVQNLFFGEFRSHWMHSVRSVIDPERTVLMDDGAVTITVDKKYLKKGIFYPKDIFYNSRDINSKIKSLFFWGLLEDQVLSKPLLTASAFLGSDADYLIDFSGVLKNRKYDCVGSGEIAYFFGSKYSEAGILSRNYELSVISKIKEYYESRGLEFCYCAHRDESSEKLDLLRLVYGVNVVLPDLPAELFLLENPERIAAIAAAYSSVINNLRFIFPGELITSFMLDLEQVNEKNRSDIKEVYKDFEKKEVFVERDF
jgi:hypothetical protein